MLYVVRSYNLENYYFQAIIVLDTIVCMFSEYCTSKYEVQQCKVFGPDGTYELYPQLQYRDELINVDKANNYIGIRYFLYTLS